MFVILPSVKFILLSIVVITIVRFFFRVTKNLDESFLKNALKNSNRLL